MRKVKLQLYLLAFAAVSAIAVRSFCIQAQAKDPSSVAIARAHADRTELATQAAMRAASGGDWKFSHDWTWANKPWTGDDDAFAEARAKIDAQFKDTRDPVATAKAYKNAAVDNPHNALEQFRWAYACYCEDRSPSTHWPTLLTTEPVLAEMANATQPHCYNYDRLHLLLMSAGPQQRGLVERLLRRDPNDLPVKFEYAGLLVDCKDRASQDKAVKIAEDLVASGQDLARCYHLEGNVYYWIALDRHDPVYSRKAIAAMNQYLALAPSDMARQLVLQVTTYLEQQMQKWK